MMRIKVLFLCLFISLSAISQDTVSVNKKRLSTLVIGSSIVYTSSLIALNQLWYADFERQPFHFFNDNNQWKQVDKIGHFYSAFHISHSAYKSLKWAGLDENKAILWGGLASVIALTPIEVFDGFSKEYGASTGDIIANTAGGLLFVGQQALWGEMRIQPKFSFNRSNYAPLRPNTLGSNFSEELLKDYNGQTYWLSINISKFKNNFPKWLNLAVGYGADAMIFANDKENTANGFRSKRQFYLALDPDLSEYKSKSKVLNTIFYFITMIKIPAPTLELKEGKFTFHSFHY